VTERRVRPFALVARRRFSGVHAGDQRSPDRGEGDEVVGSRPYRPGDRIGRIDWAASARLSSARGADEFVVREFFADRAPRVVLVCDRRPSLGLYGESFPWLDKTAAIAGIVGVVAASVRAARGDLAYADATESGTFWVPPGRARVVRALVDRISVPAAAPPRSLERSLELLVRRRSALPAGTFVFVLSDFLEPPAARVWVRLRSLRFDVTPVVVEDPVWEQSFPRLGGVVLPVVDATLRGRRDVWVGRKDAERMALANEQRLQATLGDFRRLGLDPIVVGTQEGPELERLFHAWADRRRAIRRRRP
jgi:uncharacterized protein (DUF58 family)